MISRAAALAVVGVLLLSAVDALADETDVCLSSYERAQVARKASKLRLARDQLLLCSQLACPKATRADCVPWLAEVETALPSIVVTAKEGDGREVVDVAVFFDDTPLASRLDGRSLSVDPGEHALRLVAPGHPTFETKVVIREGERDRPLSFTLPLSTEGAKPPPPAESDHSVSSRSPGGSLHPGPLVYSLGAVSLIALGSFAYFGVTGAHDAKVLRDSCYPHCTEPGVTSANRELLIADISLGVALVAAGVATYLLLTHHDAPHPAAATLNFAF